MEAQELIAPTASHRIDHLAAISKGRVNNSRGNSSISPNVLEVWRREEQPFVLCKTCAVLSGHACKLLVDRFKSSFYKSLSGLKQELGNHMFSLDQTENASGDA